MKTLKIIVTITSDGNLLVNSPVDIPVGEYNAVLVLEEQPIRSNVQPSVQNAQALFFENIFLLIENFLKS